MSANLQTESALRACLCTAALALGAPWASAAELEGTLLVANREGGSISFFDLAANVEIARLPIGPVIPHEVAVSPDGRWALTGEYGPGSQRGHRLVVMDVANALIAGYIELGAPSRPHSTVFLPDGRRALATMEDADRLALVDVTTREVLHSYPTGGREGHMVRLSPDARRAYVTSRGAEGTLSVIFLDEDRPPVVIPTGPGAEGFAVTPDGGEIWVANRQEETISIVDAARLEVVETVPSRLYAGRVEISAAGRVVVLNGTSADAGRQYLRIYDAATRALTSELPLDDGTARSGGFGLMIHGELAFVGHRGLGRILVYDLDDPGDPAVFTTNHESPDDMAWSPVRLAVFSD